MDRYLAYKLRALIIIQGYGVRRNMDNPASTNNFIPRIRKAKQASQ